jgi:hypothetical protein
LLRDWLLLLALLALGGQLILGAKAKRRECWRRKRDDPPLERASSGRWGRQLTRQGNERFAVHDRSS